MLALALGYFFIIVKLPSEFNRYSSDNEVLFVASITISEGKFSNSTEIVISLSPSCNATLFISLTSKLTTPLPSLKIYLKPLEQ